MILPSQNVEEKQTAFEEKVIEVNRISRTVKGGRRMRFRALVVVGNRAGQVGMGVAKANEVINAVSKAKGLAAKNTILVPITNDTIPHEVLCSFGGAQVLLKPGRSGSSIIAGGAIRNIIELAGIKNIQAKMLGSANKINNATAVFKALASLRSRGSETSEKETK